jgi:hypothetical protein
MRTIKKQLGEINKSEQLKTYEDLLEEDAISPSEQGFMKGWFKAENNLFEDKKGKLWMSDELDELSEWEIEDLQIHVAS